MTRTAVCRSGSRTRSAQHHPTVRRIESMAKKGLSRALPASNSCAKPGDFPLGSLESRAAARAMLGTVTAKDCICFPPEEPPDLDQRNGQEGYRGFLQYIL